ncbi:SIR2 family NAD-dependent protein deacylase [Cellulomonas sp. NPDC055163]
MLTLPDLVRNLTPARTVLFLGAGAAVKSGGPAGSVLGQRLVALLSPESGLAGDLADVASVLELRRGRAELISALRSVLADLQPTGGILSLPEYDWAALYGTNYDYLVERSYERAGRALAVSRSNFDYNISERNPDATPYYKIHGCLSQDTVDGQHARIVLTEGDYDEYSSYREVLFKRLDLDLQTRDLVVIGSSLRDPHIKKYMDEAARLHRERHAPGRLYAVIYEEDEERATLLERKGYAIAFGSLDAFMDELAQVHVPSPLAAPGPGIRLQGALTSKTTSIEHARTLSSNATRLFNGAPATYADIADGLTFQREIEPTIVQAFSHRNRLVVTITGTGGVGKTTLARRVLTQMQDLGYSCWEHDPNFPFLRSEWLSVEAQLRASGLYGILLVDDCTPILSQLNQLLTHLSQIPDCALLIVVTAGSTQWRPRTKSPIFFTHGEDFVLSRLTPADLNDLLNLVDRQPQLRNMIAPAFALATRSERYTLLRRRCAADMYVCLKNVFASESLDGILLREYAELSEDNQNVYRLVAALEATGAQVHRQLVLRLLGVEAGTVQALLQLLEGVVDEFDIRPTEGIFGLSTRHRVIAQTIANYKFADQDERYNLFRQVLDGLNPTVFLELRLARELCDREYGIGSLTSDDKQVELYRQLVALVPGERIPRHRLIAQYLHMGELDLAEREIREAVDAVRLDPPLARYSVRLLMQRAVKTPGIMREDRHALLLRAESKALEAMRKFANDPYSYVIRADVALAIAELLDDGRGLDDAIEILELKYSELREPNMAKAISRLRDSQRGFARPTTLDNQTV